MTHDDHHGITVQNSNSKLPADDKIAGVQQHNITTDNDNKNKHSTLSHSATASNSRMRAAKQSNPTLLEEANQCTVMTSTCSSKPNHLSIFNDPRPPFEPSRQPKLENINALQEAMAIFRKLKNKPQDPSNPNLSQYEPSSRLLSSMQRLMESHNQHHQQNTTPRTCTPESGEDLNQDIEDTPKVIQRNAMGGRAWLTESTPRTNSRRKKRNYGSNHRKLKHLGNLHSDTVERVRGGASKRVPHMIQFPKEDERVLSPVGISATQESLEDDFAFHSQSSMPE
jgi:hypothetical protein